MGLISRRRSSAPRSLGTAHRYAASAPHRRQPASCAARGHMTSSMSPSMTGHDGTPSSPSHIAWGQLWLQQCRGGCARVAAPAGAAHAHTTCLASLAVYRLMACDNQRREEALLYRCAGLTQNYVMRHAVMRLMGASRPARTSHPIPAYFTQSSGDKSIHSYSPIAVNTCVKR